MTKKYISHPRRHYPPCVGNPSLNRPGNFMRRNTSGLGCRDKPGNDGLYNFIICRHFTAGIVWAILRPDMAHRGNNAKITK
jgi:hypothetical protein